MTVNWWTIALQAINFLVLIWLLQRLLYKPVLGVIARRKQLVDNAFADAERAKQAALAEQQRYEEDRAQLTASRSELLSKAHTEIEADRAKVLEDAGSEAAAMLQSMREQITAERKAALADAKAQVADLAVDMAARLLQRAVGQPGTSIALNDAFLAQLVDRLKALPEDERHVLRSDLEGNGEGLRVATGYPLEAQEQERWQCALEAEIGRVQAFEFVVEPALIGGAELRFPHAVVSLAWSELLRQGKQALLTNENHH